MQTLHHTFKIDEIGRKNNLLEILSDKYCRTIIESITYKPKSVMEITRETQVPMSTTYRKIQLLHDSKLLKISGIITDDGKKLFLYKSKIRGIQSVFHDGVIEVELILNN